MYFCQKYHRSDVPFSGHDMRNIYEHDLTTCGVNFDFLFQVVSSRFLHWRIAISIFVINEYHVRGYFEMM